MHGVELRGAGAVEAAGAGNAVVGLVAISAPVALVRAGIGVKHNDAPVAVAIGDEDLVGFRIHTDSRGPVQIFGIVAAAGFAVMADLQQKLSGFRELEDIGVLGSV